MGKIANALYSAHYRWVSSRVAQLVGLIHTLMPVTRRVFFDQGDNDVCFPPPSLERWDDVEAFISQLYYYLTGGHAWFHLFASVPSNLISGYLVYRLVFITSVCFYNDLEFYNKLLLFRASCTSHSFLRSRSHWIKRAKKMSKVEPLIQSLILQKHDPKP